MATIRPEEFLGAGPILPFGLNSRGDVKNAEGVENVRSCVRLLFGTRPGELRWNPTFGIDLDPLIHSGGRQAFIEDARRRVYNGFSQEPRVIVQNVDARLITSTGRLDILMEYRPIGRLAEQRGIRLTERITV